MCNQRLLLSSPRNHLYKLIILATFLSNTVFDIYLKPQVLHLDHRLRNPTSFSLLRLQQKGYFTLTLNGCILSYYWCVSLIFSSHFHILKRFHFTRNTNHAFLPENQNMFYKTSFLFTQLCTPFMHLYNNELSKANKQTNIYSLFRLFLTLPSKVKELWNNNHLLVLQVRYSQPT